MFSSHEALKSAKPYPRKCYLPFILYPPAMYENKKGYSFLKEDLKLNDAGSDYVFYVSIPFCRVRCKGCPYFVERLSRSDKNQEEDQYINALIKDIEHWASFPKWKTGLLRSIYIGGGTGSIIKTKNLKRLVDAIMNQFNVSPDYCMTLEGNASDYDNEKLDYVAHSAITRVSLGVQSFSPEMLKVVGSPHAATQSIQAIKALQSRGFYNIQMDLMYNMPGHTLEIWKQDLETLAALQVPHFTAYLYRLHEDTPQHQAVLRGKVKPLENPESILVHSMKKELREVAESLGYVNYMVDHYAKPGHENKYNHWSWKIYTDALAIGPGAYSYFDGYRIGVEKDIKKYIESVEKSETLISTISQKMNSQVEKERYIIFTLLYYCVEYEAYFNRFKSNLLEDFSEVIKKLENKELIKVKDKGIYLTDLGVEWHMNILLEFFNLNFWDDAEALNEPNWSMNIPMVQIGASKREYWLG